MLCRGTKLSCTDLEICNIILKLEKLLDIGLFFVERVLVDEAIQILVIDVIVISIDFNAVHFQLSSRIEVGTFICKDLLYIFKFGSLMRIEIFVIVSQDTWKEGNKSYFFFDLIYVISVFFDSLLIIMKEYQRFYYFRHLFIDKSVTNVINICISKSLEILITLPAVLSIPYTFVAFDSALRNFDVISMLKPLILLHFFNVFSVITVMIEGSNTGFHLLNEVVEISNEDFLTIIK